jgi:Domain of unknown function (DUF4384)
MRLSIILFALICISAAVIVGVPLAPQEQEDVRGAFLTSRPKEKTEGANATARPSRRRPRSETTSTKTSSGPKPKGTPTPTTPKPTPTPAADASKPTSVNAGRLGLGLTLFTRDSNGLSVRVDPDHIFQKGDRVRVLLETNTDGYIYIFNTTDDGQPVMLYPDPQLDEAGNYLQAHVPFEIPSSLAAEERLRWLVFDEHAGNERLYFVFTREPLAGVPIEDDLINRCRDAKPPCPWHPTAEVWAQVQQQKEQPLKTDKAERYGKPQTATEHQATTRGLGLAKDDPQPSLILMASSSNSVLVTTLDLVHK